MGYTAPELRRIAEMVDEETRRLGLLRTRERIDREIEHGVRVVRQPRDVNLHGRAVTLDAHTAATPNGGGPAVIDTDAGPVYADFACRTEGCENRANARYDRGPYYRLCYEQCLPARRDQMSADQIARRANGRRTVAPPPAEPTLADLADALERANRFVEDARQEWEEAAEALLAHPLMQEILP